MAGAHPQGRFAGANTQWAPSYWPSWWPPVAGGEYINEPPLISRNDAARIVCHVAGEGLPSLGGATLDVAWQDRWGTTSAGTDETARAAARQDVMADAAAAVFGMAKQEEAAAAAAA